MADESQVKKAAESEVQKMVSEIVTKMKQSRTGFGEVEVIVVSANEKAPHYQEQEYPSPSSLQTGKKVAEKVHECLQGITEEFQRILADDGTSAPGFPSGPPGFRLEEWSAKLHVDANGEVSWIPFVTKGGMSAGASLTFTFKRDNRAAGSS